MSFVNCFVRPQDVLLLFLLLLAELPALEVDALLDSPDPV
jgi:hypothetical protein